MKLIASRPVLYAATQYGAGDILPVTDDRMVAAWIECGSAAWVDEDQIAETAKPAIAKMAAAEPGLPGISSDGDPDAMVGKIPKTPQRKRSKGSVKK